MINDEGFERASGLVYKSDINTLKDVIMSMMYELRKEGFDDEDIISYITTQTRLLSEQVIHENPVNGPAKEKYACQWCHSLKWKPSGLCGNCGRFSYNVEVDERKKAHTIAMNLIERNLKDIRHDASSKFCLACDLKLAVCKLREVVK